MNNIKNIKIFFFLILFTFIFTQSKSEIKIAIIEMERVITQSLAGKSLLVQVKKIDDKNKKYFSATKKKLDSEKNKINSQKNILSKEEYEKKVLTLNKDFKNYQSDGKQKIKLFETKRNNVMKKIINEVNLILSEYSDKNQLTLIIDQNNIVMGKKNLNITDEILKLLDTKMKKVSLN